MARIKLTMSDVKKIIELYKVDDLRAVEIAERYGISQTHVLRLIRNNGWTGQNFKEED